MITSIPIDIQNRIAHFLGPRDLAALAPVSRACARLVDESFSWSARLEKAAWLSHLGKAPGVGPALDEIGARILEHHLPQLSTMRAAAPSSVLSGVRRAARIAEALPPCPLDLGLAAPRARAVWALALAQMDEDLPWSTGQCLRIATRATLVVGDQPLLLDDASLSPAFEGLVRAPICLGLDATWRPWLCIAVHTTHTLGEPVPAGVTAAPSQIIEHLYVLDTSAQRPVWRRWARFSPNVDYDDWGIVGGEHSIPDSGILQGWSPRRAFCQIRQVLEGLTVRRDWTASARTSASTSTWSLATYPA